MSSRMQEREARRAARLEAEQRAAAQGRRRRLLQLGAALVVAAVVAVVLIVVSQQGSDEPGGGEGGVAAATNSLEGIPQDGVALGDPDAPVTLVEFADLQCPFCRDYSQQVLPTLLEEYVRDGQVRLEYQPVAILGLDSTRAAQVAAAAALQDHMWGFVETFYANQGQENSGYVTDEFLRDVAGAVPGLDAEQVLAQRDQPQALRVLERAENAARTAGIGGTPSFLLGPTGGPLEALTPESLSPDAFTQAIDDALAEAEGGS